MPEILRNYYLGKARAAGGRIWRVVGNLRSVTLRPQGSARGRVLLSYVLDGFLERYRNSETPMHTNIWETRLMAETFLNMGYQVDVISWLNRMFLPKVEYAAFIDVRHNMERLAPYLGKRCRKIFHIDCAHLNYLNAAESRRLLELQQRRGITLPPRRFETPNLGIEYADCATMLGNAFTRSTYEYAGKPIYPVPLPSCVTMPWPSDKDWTACRKTFIWMGSAGFVHKGLDRVLDAFAAMPDYNLLVCGPLDMEPDFRKAFHRELYGLPNIKTLGWMDVASTRFTELARSAVAMVHPSCSEGQSGAVVTCMHAALIPIVSVQSGVDVDGFGVVLHDCSVGEIQAAVREISQLDSADLERRARSAWATAHQTYTRENYTRVFSETVELLLGQRSIRKDAIQAS